MGGAHERDAHDLGGRMDFGPVAPEVDEPVFHAGWERRALGLVLAAGGMGHWPIDESRHARESLPSAEYLASCYYEIWIKGLERLLLRHGFVTQEELSAGRMIAPASAAKRVLSAARVSDVLAQGSPCARAAKSAPLFRVGEEVRTIAAAPEGHTRLPGYARGKSGTIALVHDVHVFPDSNAHGRGEKPQWLYTVSFSGSELWGAAADPGLVVSIDAFESYLAAA
jgi:nitrile hydratase subunit beta